MAATISPREKILTLLACWWVPAAAAILGGLIGLGIFALKTPVYEAQAAVTMGIDFARTGYMEQYDKDLALGMAANIISSVDVMQRVVADAQSQGIAIDFDTLFRNFTLERKSYVWILRVRYTDPEQAATITNRWIELGIADLDQAAQHALRADGLREYLYSLEHCIEQMAVNAIVPACPYDSAGSLQTALAEAEVQYLEQRTAARNLFPHLTYEVTQTAVPPHSPVLYGRNNLVLAGLLIGLLIGTAIVTGEWPARWQKKP